MEWPLIERALAKNPDDRYQTCRKMAMDYVNAVGYTLHGHKLRLFTRREAQFVTGGIIYGGYPDPAIMQCGIYVVT